MEASQTKQAVFLTIFCMLLLSGCALIDGLTGSLDDPLNNDPDSGNPIDDSGNPIHDSGNPIDDSDSSPDNPERCSAENSCGESGICTDDDRCIYPTEISAGAEQVCALYKENTNDKYGAIGCWPNNLGQIHRKIIPITNGQDVYTNNVKAFSTGTANTCAIIKPNASSPDQIYCWGAGLPFHYSPTPARVIPTPEVPALNFDGITVGKQHICIHTQNNIYCWGNNTYGQLANGTRDALNQPTTTKPVAAGNPVSGPFISVTTKDDHTCALDHNTMWCWGNNENGQLGYGTTSASSQSSPTSAQKVSLIWVNTKTPKFTHFIDAATGPSHTCAVIGSEPEMQLKNVYCWGSGSDSKLGFSESSNRAQPDNPIIISGDAPLQAIAVALGKNFSCALTSDSKKVMCWGGGFNRTTAIEVPNINKGNLQIITQIDATPNQICALLIDENQAITSTKIQCYDPPS